MLLKEFKWNKYLAVAVQAKLNGHTVVAIVDTGSAGNVVLKSCFDQLGMVKDNELEFTITSANNTNKNLRTVLFSVNIMWGENSEGPGFFAGGSTCWHVVGS